MKLGEFCFWDYQSWRDAAQELTQNHMDWTVVAETQHYPPLPKAGDSS